MSDIKKTLFSRRHYLDGSTGTYLVSRGLEAGKAPCEWNTERPEEIYDMHTAYLNAGADIIITNTFSSNSLKYDNFEILIKEGVKIALKARDDFSEKTGKDAFVAYGMGPSGKLISPLGDLGFEDAVEIYASQVRAMDEKADVILIETMNDLRETKAAVLAAKENSSLPVFVTNAYNEDGRLMCGASPLEMVSILEGLGVDALGVNCSFGPYQMKSIVSELVKYSSIPVIVSPNAGMPKVENGKTVYDITPDEFASVMTEIAKMGGSVLGGCCGTTPEYIEKTVALTENIPLPEINKKNLTVVSSYSESVLFEDASRPVLIGERINPTGKKLLREALKNSDTEYILSLASSQADAGADILDINVGVPGIDETETMGRTVEAVQKITSLPLQIDSGNYEALEKGLRLCAGKPLINSVNGTKESLERVLPLQKKYGGVLVCLTLDENGIPEDSTGRIAIARKIVEAAERYGIGKKDIIIDPLVLTVSAQPSSALVTLECVSRIKKELGVKTSLGLSNVSFGLPMRDVINARFLSMALTCGLDCAIVNPLSEEIKKSVLAFRALSGKDENFSSLISYADENAEGNAEKKQKDGSLSLKDLIIKGLAPSASSKTADLLEIGIGPMEIIDSEIIPALNEVGNGFEKGKIYLPGLLMSADAAKSAFDVIKCRIGKEKGREGEKIVLATVKGDVHDIGKNIVKVLLENYGFSVIDLGRDVPAQDIVSAALESGAKLVGLSALMTTTLPAMEETISLLKKTGRDIKTVVGGAVLTEEYALGIGADCYAADAMQTVRYAEIIYRKNSKGEQK